MEIEIGARVHVVGRTSPAVGCSGTVLLVTRAGDGVLVETDEPFAAALGISAGRVPPVSRRRVWCAPEDLGVDGPAPAASPAPRVRRFDPPSDLRAARRSTRHARVAMAFADIVAGTT